jgi:hypothetical protein
MDHCKQAFCDFVGERAFEDDAGWSWEVFQHGYQAGLLAAEQRFKRLGNIPLTGNEAASEIGKLK